MLFPLPEPSSCSILTMSLSTEARSTEKWFAKGWWEEPHQNPILKPD